MMATANKRYSFSKHQEKYLNLRELLHHKNQQISAGKLVDFFETRINRIDHHKALLEEKILEDEAKLVKPVISELDELHFKIQELVNGMSDKFLLFVVGMGNVGKSTLINSLLEQDAAVMDILPKTWKIDVFENRPGDECEIIYKSGEVKRLSIAKTNELIEEEERKATESRKQVRADIKKNAPKPKTREERDELKDLEKKLTYKSDIIEVRWPIKANRLSEKFKLVDTPGLVQDNLSGETKYSLQEYYHKADGVIWILDANKLAAAKQDELMSELTEALEVVGGSTENIVCVINRIDSIKGGEESTQRVLGEAKRLFGQYFQTFIPVSAKAAYEGYKRSDSLSRETSKIANVYKEIDDRFFHSAQSMKLKSKESSLRQLLKSVEVEDQPILTYHKRLEKDQHQYRQQLNWINDTLKEKKRQYQTEMANLKASATSQVEQRIHSLTDNLFDFESEAEKRAYMLESIFRVQEVESQVQQLVRYWGEVIQSATKELHPEILFKEYEYVDEEVVQAIIQGSGQAQLSVNQTMYDFKELRRENQLPSLTSTKGMENFFQDILGNTLGGILGSIGKGIVKLFTMGSVKNQLRGHFDSYMENHVKQSDELLENQTEACIYYLVNEMHASYKELHGDYEISLTRKERLEQLMEEIKEPYQRPDLMEIFSKEKAKLSHWQTGKVASSKPGLERNPPFVEELQEGPKQLNNQSLKEKEQRKEKVLVGK
jgi:predicted GTPase